MDSDVEVSYDISCSDGLCVGSRCDLSCSDNEFLLGVTQIQCLENQKWNVDLASSYTYCILRVPTLLRECPADIPQVEYYFPLCLFAECPEVPEASCFKNRCKSCPVDFFFNGKMINQERLYPAGE